MIVYYDKNLESDEVRAHPWVAAKDNPNNKYYDFKKNPELIETVLEDFIPWSSYKAIVLFYNFLRWLNSLSSKLESNDCAFLGLEENTDKKFAKKLRCCGRVIVFFRKQELNLQKEYYDWLWSCFDFYIKRFEPDFKWGAIGLSKVPTKFVKLHLPHQERKGCILKITFWAYGDSKKETMSNLEKLFSVLFEAAKNVSREIEGAEK